MLAFADLALATEYRPSWLIPSLLAQVWRPPHMFQRAATIALPEIFANND